MLGSNIYMSDIIGELYTTWKDCLVILNGGTGCGKLYRKDKWSRVCSTP